MLTGSPDIRRVWLPSSSWRLVSAVSTIHWSQLAAVWCFSSGLFKKKESLIMKSGSLKPFFYYFQLKQKVSQCPSVRHWFLVFLTGCCDKLLYIFWGENGWILCNKNITRVFFFSSLTNPRGKKCCVIGRRRSASWQSHYYPRANMSQPIDIKSLSESTKKYFITGGNLPWLMWCWLLVSHALSPPAFVIYFSSYWWTQKSYLLKV